jgi:hypothetical protein
MIEFGLDAVQLQGAPPSCAGGSQGRRRKRPDSSRDYFDVNGDSPHPRTGEFTGLRWRGPAGVSTMLAARTFHAGQFRRRRRGSGSVLRSGSRGVGGPLHDWEIGRAVRELAPKEIGPRGHHPLELASSNINRISPSRHQIRLPSYPPPFRRYWRVS